MLLDFFAAVLHSWCEYVPVVAGAYIGFLILRFPDLTIEGSWCLGGIAACLAATVVHPAYAFPLGAFVGALCGCLTYAIFVSIGRLKLLAGILSYYILEALGFHLLGDKRAAVYLDYAASRFGLADSPWLSASIYGAVALLILLGVIFWQRSHLGLEARLIGERPQASMFFGLSIKKCYFWCLVISNALVGLGGGMWGLYHGQASNVQGIGMVLKALFSILLGDMILRILGASRRAVPATVAVGTAVFVLVTHASEFVQARFAAFLDNSPFRPTDKQFLVAVALVALLWTRVDNAERKGTVSEW